MVWSFGKVMHFQMFIRLQLIIHTSVLPCIAPLKIQLLFWRNRISVCKEYSFVYVSMQKRKFLS